MLTTVTVFSLVSCLFVFLRLSFQSSLSILDAGPLCDMCFASIFFQPVACLFCRAEVFNINKNLAYQLFVLGLCLCMLPKMLLLNSRLAINSFSLLLYT